MTSLPPAQPMSRRERRLLEERELFLAQASVPTPAAPGAFFAAAESVPQPPIPPLVPPAPPKPMSRRERKMLEETGAIPRPSEFGAVAEPRALADTSLVGVAQDFPPQPYPVGLSPLPPVFGLPATTAPAPVFSPPRVDEQPPPLTTPISPSRVVGEIPMATSSLILPQTPVVDMTGPIGDTGEVIMTGQITLPNRLAETGTMPSMREDRDDDERFDAYVTGELAAMSQPIRAAKAVSGQGDDTDILLVRRVRWGTAAILAATGAAVLGIGAVVLLVVALLTDALV